MWAVFLFDFKISDGLKNFNDPSKKFKKKGLYERHRRKEKKIL